MSATVSQRAPIGTPERTPENRPFSHIQIVPKVSPKASVNDEDSPVPTFRKPSFTQEVGSQMNSSNDIEALNSNVSLVNDLTDATFASRARAAELSAARSRRILEDQANKPDASEPMKFTKPRAKPTRAWRPLDLTELPEAQSDPEEINTPSEYAYYDGVMVRHVYPGVTSTNTLHPHNFPQLSKASPSLADPLSAKLTTADTNTELHLSVLAGSTKEPPLSRASFDFVDSHPSSHPSSAMPFDTTMPNLPRDGTIGNNSSKGSHAMMMDTINQLVSSHEVNSEMEEHFQNQSRNDEKVKPLGIMLDRNKDPFADTNPSRPIDFQDQHSRYVLAQPVPYKYPAVKGTMNHSFKFQPEQSDVYNSQYQSPRKSQMTYKQEIPLGNIPNTQTKTQVYYPSSSKDQKDLKRHLNALIEPQSSFPLSTHTPLHQSKLQPNSQALSTTETPMISNPTNAETEFMRLSDPLPWKERPVRVVRSPLRSNVETAYTASYISPRTNRHRQAPSSLLMDDSVAERLKETESWWDGDTRPCCRNLQDITIFLSNASAAHLESRRDLALESQARRAANFPDDWSESSASTAVPEHPDARDIGYNLLVPVLTNLSIYLDRKGDFGRFGKVPEWCIDKSSDGYLSYFGEDWGAPPPRVGRDPRYRPMLHEGRYTVFEDLGGRGGLSGSGRRAR